MSRKRASISPDALRAELDAELTQIYKEITGLRINQHIFWEVQKMIGKNPNLKKPSTFYQWMGNMYAVGMTAAIRRLVDRTKGTVSFVRMLERLKANPKCVSRSWYMKQFHDPKTHLPRKYLEKTYDAVAGDGREYPDPKDIEKQVAALVRVTEKAKRFVDGQVAHRSKQPPKTVPTFQDVDDAVEELEKLLKRYVLLFRSTSLSSALPVWQFDWTEIFRYPWLES